MRGTSKHVKARKKNGKYKIVIDKSMKQIIVSNLITLVASLCDSDNIVK